MNEISKKKVGIVCICLNPQYWQFANEMLWGVNTFFLGHPSIRDKYSTEIILWSDIPEEEKKIAEAMAVNLAQRGEIKSSAVSQNEINFLTTEEQQKEFGKIIQGIADIRKKGVKIFPTESIEWPMPTLMRYHLFLQQEEYLQQFDYLFYIDVDMQIVDWIGEEILGEGLTAAQHPMYALRQSFYPPYDPNPESSAYIKLPGKLIEENGVKRFQPYYYAGGFQGGKTKDFLDAARVMRKNIDDDFNKNYIARWNDESHFNRYLFDNPPAIVLSPSYIYPDSLISQYYVKAWGRNYSPKIMTLTKRFSTTKEAGEVIAGQLATL